MNQGTVIFERYKLKMYAVIMYLLGALFALFTKLAPSKSVSLWNISIFYLGFGFGLTATLLWNTKLSDLFKKEEQEGDKNGITEQEN